MSSIENRLREKKLSLPPAPPPAANYVPYVISGNMLYIAGQISKTPETAITGCVGKDITPEEGRKAAQICALNILSQVGAALGGDWNRVVRCVKLCGFVNCTPDFDGHPAVVNGASDLMVAVLDEKGKHARCAVGAPSLPMNVAVEIDAVFEIKT